jgi:hypothetical protein
MKHDFQHRGQEERLSLVEQIDALCRAGALQRRSEWEESRRQPTLPATAGAGLI